MRKRLIIYILLAMTWIAFGIFYKLVDNPVIIIALLIFAVLGTANGFCQLKKTFSKGGKDG